MTTIEEYIEQYGYHFNKKLYEWAVSMLRDRNGNRLQAKTKEDVDAFLKTNGVTLKDNKGWDAAYVLHRAKAKLFGSSITDDAHLAKYVSDIIDDAHGTGTEAFDHFVIDCRAADEPVFWEDFL